MIDTQLPVLDTEAMKVVVKLPWTLVFGFCACVVIAGISHGSGAGDEDDGVKEGRGKATANAIPEPTPEESFELWLQDREFVWRGTNADEVTIRFEGEMLRVIVDGRKILEREYEYQVLSPAMLRFVWGNGEVNLFTISDDRRTFSRFMLFTGRTQEGAIRARTGGVSLPRAPAP